MITKRKFLLGVTAVIFTVFEALMFYMIHIANVDTDLNLRYISIIAAVIFSWLTFFIELFSAGNQDGRISDVIFSKTNGNLIRIAMLFTLVADYFLVALDEPNNLAGVIVFLGTQFFIFLHIFLNDASAEARTINIIVRLVLMLTLIVLAYSILGEDADSLALISVIYYANLSANLIFANRIGRGGMVLTIGLILFALCDINVGLSGLESIYTGGFPEGSFLYNIMNTGYDLVWIFYIPSQTLIPLTLIFIEDK